MKPIHTYRNAAAILTTVLVLQAGSAFAYHGANACTQASLQMFMSDRTEAVSDLWQAWAKARNLETTWEQRRAMFDAILEYRDAMEEASAVYYARRTLCGRLGEGKYIPDIDPDNFLDPSEIATDPNPLLPLVPGTTYRYFGETEDGPEEIVVEVLHETREILDVECVVVLDTAFLDGEMIEQTLDWYSQDEDGNVWYFGERSFEIEDDEIVSLEGSWEAGEDGAHPGIVMQGAPEVGDIYRQEFLLGEAEDIGEVLAEDQAVTVPHGAFGGCLQTADTTPLEPGGLEHKYYAPGVGLVLEVKPETGVRVELVEVTTGN